jgi:thioredoxin reductase
MTAKADLVVIGAGPAGLAAAASARRHGIANILVIEREPFPGGILNQCIHDGFGVIKFGETLTGPEYAHRYLQTVRSLDIPILTGRMAVDLRPDRVITVSSSSSFEEIEARAVILAMGCRERTRGALGIPGSRPAGIFTAGVVQHLMNLKNIMVGRRIVILGSGDIGLIMARRLTLEGAYVEAVVEKLPYPSGLARNLTQCLEDFNIPLLLEHTVTKITGRDRLSAVTISRVGPDGEPVRHGSRVVACDTLLLSVGLIPENELARKASVPLHETTGGPITDEFLQTAVPGFFSCGNALQVHDLVDHVSDEGEAAGEHAAAFIHGRPAHPCPIAVKAGDKVRYVLPARISGTRPVTFSFRVTEPQQQAAVVFRAGERTLSEQRFRRLSPAEMVRIPFSVPIPSGTDHLIVEVIS